MGKESEIYIYIYKWFTLLDTWNKRNIISHLYSNKIFKNLPEFDIIHMEYYFHPPTSPPSSFEISKTTITTFFARDKTFQDPVYEWRLVLLIGLKHLCRMCLLLQWWGPSSRILWGRVFLLMLGCQWLVLLLWMVLLYIVRLSFGYLAHHWFKLKQTNKKT